jgi:hypothetical protein
MTSRTWLYLAWFAAWQICAIPLYRAEWKGSVIAAGLYRASEEDRRFYADGPVYSVLHTAQQFVPIGGSALFITPTIDPEGWYLEGKFKYYMWPRRLLLVPAARLRQERTMPDTDGIVLFDPRGQLADVVAFLDGLPTLTKVHELSLGRTYQAIYLKRH